MDNLFSPFRLHTAHTIPLHQFHNNNPWGFITTDNVTEAIYCGDAETSGTIELNFEFIGEAFKGIDNDLKIEFVGNEMWDPGSQLYYAISVYLSATFDKTVMPSLIYGAYDRN